MRILFIHPNFPAQFRHLAAVFGREKSHQVLFLTKNERPEWNIPGTRKVLYAPEGETPEQVHRLAAPLDTAVREGEAVFAACRKLRASGFKPDLVYAHSGWGTTLYLRDLWPDVPMLCYFEWFYDPNGADAVFDLPQGAERGPSLLRTRNAPIFNDLWTCDQGLCPTRWQHSQFPPEYRGRIAVLHDGVDTGYFVPDPGARAALEAELELDLAGAEVVTYAARGMEPYRGFPQFMEAMALLLERRKRTHVIIAGSERICYGGSRPDGRSWKQAMLEKLDPDPARVHFTGSLPYGKYRVLLQSSTAHVYLTRPFVLSWSVVEAMACGCQVVGSDTPPVRELIRHGENGLLADFFSPQDIALRVEEALEDKGRAERLRTAARATAEERYALSRLLPIHAKLMVDTARGAAPAQRQARRPGQPSGRPAAQAAQADQAPPPADPPAS